MNMNNI